MKTKQPSKLIIFAAAFLSNPMMFVSIYIYSVRGTYNNYPDFFRMGTFIDSTHIKL